MRPSSKLGTIPPRRAGRDKRARREEESVAYIEHIGAWQFWNNWSQGRIIQAFIGDRDPFRCTCRRARRLVTPTDPIPLLRQPFLLRFDEPRERDEPAETELEISSDGSVDGKGPLEGGKSRADGPGRWS